jgi:hypothetical protein
MQFNDTAHDTLYLFESKNYHEVIETWVWKSNKSQLSSFQTYKISSIYSAALSFC